MGVGVYIFKGINLEFFINQLVSAYKHTYKQFIN